MALQDGVLYAVVGEQEMKDEVKLWKRDQHGWPWTAISRGYNVQEQPWGYGRNVLAIDVSSKRIVWHYHEKEPIDTRAVCMSDGQLYAFRFGDYLTCLDIKTGDVRVAQNQRGLPGIVRDHGRVPATTGLADKLAHGCLPEMQQGSDLFRRHSDGKLAWRSRPRMAASSGSILTTTFS